MVEFVFKIVAEGFVLKNWDNFISSDFFFCHTENLISGWSFP